MELTPWEERKFYHFYEKLAEAESVAGNPELNFDNEIRLADHQVLLL